MDTGEILEVFRYQYDNCPTYRRYAQLLGMSPEGLTDISDIPFLPIRFFKQYDIAASGAAEDFL